MKNSKQIKALAVCDGYFNVSFEDGRMLGNHRKRLSCFVPDYLNSDGAMDALVRGLSDEERKWYVSELRLIVCGKPFFLNGSWAAFEVEMLTGATAEQKAEAYLRAKGLWEVEKERAL